MKYNAKQYLQLVEGLNDTILKKYMKDEVSFINNIMERKGYEVFDLGAGYGRIIPQIINQADSIVAIELNKDMYYALEKSQMPIEDVLCINNDITKLSSYLQLKADNNLFILCQNTLGVIDGDYLKMFDNIKELSRGNNTEIVISVFNKEALPNYGLSMYMKLKDMVGSVDLEKTNFEKGEFISETGYYTKWWSKAEIIDIKSRLNGRMLNELITEEYSIYHFQISQV
jgi:SAM-dependent methyltransferase